MATFTLYLPDEVLTRLDVARGVHTRSAWIRASLEASFGEVGVPYEPSVQDQKTPAPEAERSPEPDSTPETPQEPSKAQKLTEAREALNRAEAFRTATQ